MNLSRCLLFASLVFATCSMQAYSTGSTSVSAIHGVSELKTLFASLFGHHRNNDLVYKSCSAIHTLLQSNDLATIECMLTSGLIPQTELSALHYDLSQLYTKKAILHNGAISTAVIMGATSFFTAGALIDLCYSANITHWLLHSTAAGQASVGTAAGSFASLSCALLALRAAHKASTDRTTIVRLIDLCEQKMSIYA